MNDLLEQPRKIVDCVKVVNPLPESLDELCVQQALFIDKGFLTEVIGERISKNVEIVKLVVYERGER